MKKPLHPISDHAVLRYLERAKGVDVEAVRRELGRRVDAACAEHAGMSAAIIDGIRFVISADGVVVTAHPQHLPERGHGGHRGRKARGMQ